MSDRSYFEPGPPTRVSYVREALLGAQIVKMTRYCDDTPTNAVMDNSFRSCPISNRDLFAYAAGSLVIELDSGISIGADSDITEWGSVILWVERDMYGNETPDYPRSQEPDQYPIDACDSLYSDAEMCAIIGRTIKSILVYQGDEVIARPQWPCEVAVRLIMDNGEELVFCHHLRDGGSDDFSVRTKSRIPDGYFEGLKEVCRV